MTAGAYEERVLETSELPTYIKERLNGKDPHLAMCLAALGLGAESGGLAQTIKQVVFHDAPYNRARLLKELGQLHWYFTFLYLLMGFSLEEIQEANAKTLRKLKGDTPAPVVSSLEIAIEMTEEVEEVTEITAVVSTEEVPEFSAAALHKLAAAERNRNPEWRAGQAYWYVASTNWPELAERFRGKSVDPFHDDTRISAFIAALFTALYTKQDGI